jgi:hypothetical protein
MSVDSPLRGHRRGALLPRALAFAVAVLCLAPSLGASEDAAPLESAAVPAEDPTVTAATAFYDWLSDASKKRVYQRIAKSYDTDLDGKLERGIDRPARFGVMRLYPKGYDIVRRVSGLPLEKQQRVYDHIRGHQLRSGWIK